MVSKIKNSSGKARVPFNRKALLFLLLSILWIFPSSGALFIIGNSWVRWFHAPSMEDALRSVTFEQWVALVLLLLQLFFTASALFFHYHSDPENDD